MLLGNISHTNHKTCEKGATARNEHPVRFGPELLIPQPPSEPGTLRPGSCSVVSRDTRRLFARREASRPERSPYMGGVRLVLFLRTVVLEECWRGRRQCEDVHPGRVTNFGGFFGPG